MKINRKNFADSLKYGSCEGSADICQWNNPGDESSICPVDEAGNIEDPLLYCNCCEQCRKECTSKAYIIMQNLKEYEAKLEKLCQDIKEKNAIKFTFSIENTKCTNII